MSRPGDRQQNGGAGLLAFDLDGTVFSDHVDERVSTRVGRAFSELHEAGWSLVVATGRNRGELGGIDDEPWLDWIICSNGAAIYRAGETDPQVQFPMTLEQVLRVRDALGELPEHYWLQGPAGMFVDGLFTDENGQLVAPGGAHVVDDPFSAPGGELGFYKLIARHRDERTRRLSERRLAPIAEPYEITNQGPTSLEVTLAGVSKGTAALEVCRLCGADPARSVAFGDSGNDLSFADTPLTFVVMDSAEQGVIDAADDVCPDVLHDGVAVWVEEHLLHSLP